MEWIHEDPNEIEKETDQFQRDHGIFCSHVAFCPMGILKFKRRTWELGQCAGIV